MRQLILLIPLVVFSGCSSSSALSGSGGVDKTQSMVLNCPAGLANCYSQANEICGARGFDELARTKNSQLTAAGRLDEQSDGRQIYREDVRFEDERPSVTIRCK